MNDQALDELVTLRDWLRHAISRFNTAGLFFGHGCANATDEAIWLILGALRLPDDNLELFLDARLTRAERQAVHDLLQRRIEQRIPTAYLLHEARLGDFSFYVDERVIIPRSYFANLLENSFAPWLEAPDAVESALDLCTGSGCLAILMAHAFPDAQIDAIDISKDALAVARRNVADYGLEDRVRLIESDLFAKAGKQKYDLIVSNPPYVTTDAMVEIPAEYRHEPSLALVAGDDGLDIVRRILADAPRHLKPHGLLAVEVGHNQDLVEEAFPELPLTWIDTDDGEGKIFIIHKEQLSSPET